MHKYSKVLSIFIAFVMVLSMCGTGLSFLDFAGTYGVSYAVDGTNDNGTEPAGGDAVDSGTDQSSESVSNETDKSGSDTGKAGTKQEDSKGDKKAKDSVRTLKADAKEAALYVKGDDGKKKRSADLKSALRFWSALMNRNAEPADDSKEKAPIEVSVKGDLPEDTSAKITYIEFDEGGVYSEPFISSFELKLFDGDGSEYIPTKPVKVVVSGDRIRAALRDDSNVLVYSYTENNTRSKQYKEQFDKSFYAADAVVYRDSDSDDSRRAYEVYDSTRKYQDGEDAVRFSEDTDGLKINNSDDAVEFSYKFDKNSPARFAVSSQITERTLSDEAGNTLVSVSGALDKASGLEAKNAGMSVDESAVKGKKVVAVDVSLRDEEAGSYQPDQPVRVTIGDPSIRKAAAQSRQDGSDLKVMIIDEDGVAVPVSDAEFDGSKVSFETDELGTCVITRYTVEEYCKTADGWTWKVSATYDSDTGIPDKGVKLYVKKQFDLDPDTVGLDIKLVDEKNENKVYQPAKGTSVELKVTLLDRDTAKSHPEKTSEVLHIREDGTKETITADLGTTESGYEYTFNTGSFSTFWLILYNTDNRFEIVTYMRHKNSNTDLPGSGSSSDIPVKDGTAGQWYNFDDLAVLLGYNTAGDDNYRYAVDYAQDGGWLINAKYYAIGFYQRLGVYWSMGLNVNDDIRRSEGEFDVDLHLIDNSISLAFKKASDGTAIGDEQTYIHNFTGKEDITDVVEKYRDQLTDIGDLAYVYSKVNNSEVDTLTNSVASSELYGTDGIQWHKDAGSYWLIDYNEFGPYTYKPAYEWKYKTYSSSNYTGVGDNVFTLYFAPYVARVKINDGAWTYHGYLINNDDDPDHPGVKKGALNQAYSAAEGSTVVIETLYKNSDRYNITSGFTFDKNQNITLRTTTDTSYNKGFTSEIKRGANNTDSLITVTNGSLTLDNIAFDGNNGKGYVRQGNGGLINASECTLTVQNGAAFKNSDTFGNGGAIYAAESVVLHINEVTSYKEVLFENCNTKQRLDAGGAIYTTAKNLSLHNAVFEGCTSIDPESTPGNVQCQGGAVNHPSNHTDAYFEADNCTFRNCTAAAGGGVETQAYHITVKNCSFENCTANSRNGGGLNIYHNAVRGSAEGALISKCTFTGCKALTDKSFGGAIRSQDTNLIIEGGSISGCEATSGGAVYAEGSVTLRGGTQITGNHLLNSDVNKAAGIFISNDRQLIIGGQTSDNVQALLKETVSVTNNKTSNDVFSNVRLSESTVVEKTQNSVNSVHVLSELATTCRISVANAGVSLKGTQFGIADDNWSTLRFADPARNFVSDDASSYGKMKATPTRDSSGRYQLFWFVNAAFMITDADNNILQYKDNNENIDALFETLEQAYQCYSGNTFYEKDGSEEDPAKIKMLIQSYTIKQSITIDTKKPLILTTASRDEGYQGQNEDGLGTLLRGCGGTSLFVVNNGADVTVTKLKIDGNSTRYVADTGINNGINGGGLFSISGTNGSPTKLTLAESSKLFNSLGQKDRTRGGAVCVNPYSELIMKDNAEISDCTARAAGGVYLYTGYKNAVITELGQCPRFIMEDDAVIKNCKATFQNGGGVYIGSEGAPGGIVEIRGWAEISGCYAPQGGGAVFIEGDKKLNNSGRKFGNYLILKGSPTIKNNTTGGKASNGFGGAICIQTDTYTRSDYPLRIEGSPVFSNNYLTDNSYNKKMNGGRTVYTNGKVRQDIFLSGDVAGDNNPHKKRGNLQYIGVTGALSITGGNQIWVWAQKQNHYRKDYQFAKFITVDPSDNNPTTNVTVGTNLGTKDKNKAMSAFRNARDDVDTYGSTEAPNVKTYLCGGTGVVDDFIYWTPADGVRTVILRKMNSSHEPLKDATFNVLYSKGGSVVQIDGYGPLSGLTSNDAGIIWIGVMPYGSYYVKETNMDQKGFFLDVDQSGVEINEDE